LALGIGAIAIGLLDLFVNSEPGEKVLDAVAAPVDDAAKAVGIPDLPPIPVPELPTENPIRRRRKRKGRRKLSKAEKIQMDFAAGKKPIRAVRGRSPFARGYRDARKEKAAGMRPRFDLRTRPSSNYDAGYQAGWKLGRKR
jgi:hypothetical protein